MAKKEYKRLSLARYWFRVSSLWLGQGHLLLSNSSGFMESYRRFYFRDIQAVLWRPHNRRNVWSFAFILLYLFFLLLRLGLHQKDMDIFWFWTVFWGACIAGNFALGAGCTCQLKTAIQTVELPIKRIRSAKKFADRLKPLIETAQQDLPEGDNRTAASTLAVAIPVDNLHGQAKRPFSPLAHGILFGTLLLGALLEAGRFYTLNITYYLVESIVLLGAVIPMIAALIAQSRSETPRMLRRLTVAAILFIFTVYLLGIVSGVVSMVHHPGGSEWEMLRIEAAQAPDSTDFKLFCAIFIILVSSLLGLIGTLELLRSGRTRK